MKIRLFLSLVLLGCGNKVENKSNLDTLVVDSTSIDPITPTPVAETQTVTQNFYECQTITLTDDEREAKVWDALRPLIEQYDSTNFHTISQTYTVPGTEETPDETLNTVKTVTVTLYYNDAQELKAVKREYSYEVGGPNRFEKSYTLYLLDKDVIAFYEDKETSLDMAVKNYTRGFAKACPDCGVTLSEGISSSNVIVSGELSVADFTQWSKDARKEESDLLEYAASDSFAPSGDDYVYQTEAALDEVSNYDVFYTASKGYFERFIKPRLR